MYKSPTQILDTPGVLENRSHHTDRRNNAGKQALSEKSRGILNGRAVTLHYYGYDARHRQDLKSLASCLQFWPPGMIVLLQGPPLL